MRRPNTLCLYIFQRQSVHHFADQRRHMPKHTMFVQITNANTRCLYASPSKECLQFHGSEVSCCQTHHVCILLRIKMSTVTRIRQVMCPNTLRLYTSLTQTHGVCMLSKQRMLTVPRIGHLMLPNTPRLYTFTNQSVDSYTDQRSHVHEHTTFGYPTTTSIEKIQYTVRTPRMGQNIMRSAQLGPS